MKDMACLKLSWVCMKQSATEVFTDIYCYVRYTSILSPRPLVVNILLCDLYMVCYGLNTKNCPYVSILPLPTHEGNGWNWCQYTYLLRNTSEHRIRIHCVNRFKLSLRLTGIKIPGKRPG